jgi:hypothetical protein
MILKGVGGPACALVAAARGVPGWTAAAWRNDGAQEVPLSCGRKEMFHNISYANRGTDGRTRAFDHNLRLTDIKAP